MRCSVFKLVGLQTQPQELVPMLLIRHRLRVRLAAVIVVACARLGAFAPVGRECGHGLATGLLRSLMDL